MGTVLRIGPTGIVYQRPPRPRSGTRVVVAVESAPVVDRPVSIVEAPPAPARATKPIVVDLKPPESGEGEGGK